jgi:hypothetical protein
LIALFEAQKLVLKRRRNLFKVIQILLIFFGVKNVFLTFWDFPKELKFKIQRLKLQAPTKQ